jgi:hypothetical protein
MSVALVRLRYLVPLTGAAVLILVTFFWAPPVIWKAYREDTSEKEKTEKTRRYHHLANTEHLMDERSRLASQRERLRLFYWFHARGWPIDEGHEGSSTLGHWRDLVRYWNLNEKRG